MSRDLARLDGRFEARKLTRGRLPALIYLCAAAGTLIPLAATALARRRDLASVIRRLAIMDVKAVRQVASLAASLAACGMVALAATTQAADVKVEVFDRDGKPAGAKVTVDGKPFAEYLVRNGHQPIIWPIIGPGGQAMTRQYPMDKPLEGEPEDHPHHRSLWFNHGIVNGLDFWMEPGERDPDNQIVHREFAELESNEGVAKIVTRNDWTSNEQKVCEDLRTVTFGADANGRWIDFLVEVTATEGDVAFGDTKEGAFGLRVPGTMAVDAGKGGRIRNSRGQEDAVAWGQKAEWVDYSGPVDGRPAGITIFDMPDSFRHPTRWHVRTYGLFAANPFGQRDFSEHDRDQGEAVVKRGQKLRLHYRVLFYEGEKSDRELAAIAKEYAATEEN
jgi:hypothetical protein